MASNPRRMKHVVLLSMFFLVLVSAVLIAPKLRSETGKFSAFPNCTHRFTVCDQGIDFFKNDSAFLSWEAVAGFMAGGLTFLSICLIALIYLLDTRSAQQMARREIYQRLELASVELFRFECEHAGLVSLLWDENAKPLKELTYAQQYALKAYVFQMLNLFEMAIRFREQKIMEPDVFGSWIIWMYELCSCGRFQQLWSEIRMNYVGLLQKLLTGGIDTIRARKGDDPRTAFFQMFAQTFRCRAIGEFIDMLSHPSKDGSA